MGRPPGTTSHAQPVVALERPLSHQGPSGLLHQALHQNLAVPDPCRAKTLGAPNPCLAQDPALPYPCPAGSQTALPPAPPPHPAPAPTPAPAPPPQAFVLRSCMTTLAVATSSDALVDMLSDAAQAAQQQQERWSTGAAAGGRPAVGSDASNAFMMGPPGGTAAGMQQQQQGGEADGEDAVGAGCHLAWRPLAGPLLRLCQVRCGAGSEGRLRTTRCCTCVWHPPGPGTCTLPGLAQPGRASYPDDGSVCRQRCAARTAARELLPPQHTHTHTPLEPTPTPSASFACAAKHHQSVLTAWSGVAKKAPAPRKAAGGVKQPAQPRVENPAEGLAGLAVACLQQLMAAAGPRLEQVGLGLGF